MRKTKFIYIFKSVDFARRKIPLLIEDSEKEGPTVWVVAAIHGDEVTGTETVLRLNRFPGHPQGDHAERTAYKIFSEIKETKPALVIDLHTEQVIEADEDAVVISYADQSVCFPGTELLMMAHRNDEAFLR